jgi:hypothetical protein
MQLLLRKLIEVRVRELESGADHILEIHIDVDGIAYLHVVLLLKV